MLHIIMNPSSSTGNGYKIWKSVEKVLTDRNIKYTLYETNGPESAKNYASNITFDSSDDILIGIGGDGTMNEIFCGIKDFSKVTLGYIPSGSGGDLARDLNLSKDPLDALEAILNPKEYIYMDVGHMVNAECDKRFCVSSGIGFDAAVCHEAFRSKIKKVLNAIHLGKLTYVIIALQMLASAKKTSCKLILDEDIEINVDNLYFIATMLHRYEGGGFMFCPEAKYDDGILDLCVVGDIKKSSFLKILPTAYKGNHTKFKGINTYKAKSIKIIADKPLAIHTDGEYAGVQSEMTITLCESKIKMIVK